MNYSQPPPPPSGHYSQPPPPYSYRPSQPVYYPSHPSQFPQPQQQPPQASRAWIWIVAGLGLLMVLGTCGVVGSVGALAVIGANAATSEDQAGVQLGQAISENRKLKLRERGVLRSDEDKANVIAFYDGTVSLDMGDVSLLTTEEVIRAEEKKTTVRMRISEIMTVDHRIELGMDVIELASVNGQRMRLEIAAFNNGISFLNALEDELTRQHSTAVIHRKTAR